jgi:hypothetical protein
MTPTVAASAAALLTVSACAPSIYLPKHPTAVGTLTTVATPTSRLASSSQPDKLFADDFRGACSGATVSRATTDDPGATSHKVVLFSPYSGDLIEDTSTLPQDWMVQFDSTSDAYAKVDTVACVQVKDEQPLKECTGYQDNGHDTSNKVDLRSASYTVSVHEAATGKELGTTELDGSDDSCPMFVTFDNDSQTKAYDTPPSKDDLIAFIKPFVQP